ncbi:MAG: hypothetical protein JNJ60_15430 [Rhodocyclaceae bacterium]|nr:hypothetical protein [Rhodocyclaceae bacterium]
MNSPTIDYLFRCAALAAAALAIALCVDGAVLVPTAQAGDTPSLAVPR